jgi:hypothetical protein
VFTPKTAHLSGGLLKKQSLNINNLESNNQPGGGQYDESWDDLEELKVAHEDKNNPT